jgi:hypothetical protein
MKACAIWIEVGSTSIPTQRTCGYRRANSAMAWPPPQPTSRILAPALLQGVELVVKTLIRC